jgi:hypothetical protein
MNPGTMRLPATAQQMVDVTSPVEKNHITPTALAPQLEDPPRAATARAALTVAATTLVVATAVAGAAAAGAHHTTLAEELVAAVIAEAEATRTTTSSATHVAAVMPATELKRFVAKKASEANDSDGFPSFSARLRDLLLPEKFKLIRITKYDAKQDLVQWLRCYALSIENTGGNNDMKCLFFPFCLDQDPLTWLESLDKNSIDEWDQLRPSSPATSQVPWGARVLAWTWRWSSRNKGRRYASTCGASSTSVRS